MSLMINIIVVIKLSVVVIFVNQIQNHRDKIYIL